MIFGLVDVADFSFSVDWLLDSRPCDGTLLLFSSMEGFERLVRGSLIVSSSDCTIRGSVIGDTDWKSVDSVLSVVVISFVGVMRISVVISSVEKTSIVGVMSIVGRILNVYHTHNAFSP